METRPQPLNLSLGPPPSGGRAGTAGASRAVVALLLVSVLLEGAVLAKLFLGGGEPAAAVGGAGGAAAEKDLALALEERGLAREAADAWERYLAEAGTAEPDRPQVLYRAGKLRMDAEDWGGAVADLVAAELEAKRAGAKLEPKAGERVVECLRRLGRYGEVGRELARRADLGAGAGGSGERVLATYAGEKIAEKDLDRLIERRVDEMLALQGGGGGGGGGGGAGAGEGRREAALKQLATPEMRRRLLEDFLRTEVLARRARELGIDREDDFRRARETAEASLLASWLMDRELAKIEPTDVDVSSYYEARKGDYREPERAKVLLLELLAEDKPDEVLARVTTPEEWKAEAARRTPKEGAAAAAHEVVRGRADALLGKAAEKVFEKKPGEWLAEALEQRGRRFLVLVEERTDARVPPIEEVRERVRGDYLERKRAEWAEGFTRDLMSRYDVKIVEPEDAAEPKEGAR